MNVYIGTDSAGDTPWFGTGPLRKNDLRQTRHSFRRFKLVSVLELCCDESKLPKKDGKSRVICNSPNNPDKRVTAYTFSDDGHWYGWNAKYVATFFCPRFFDDDILTLAQMVADGWRNSTLQKIMDPWRKVKARVVYRSKRII
jgi:hypothetical protein